MENENKNENFNSETNEEKLETTDESTETTEDTQGEDQEAEQQESEESEESEETVSKKEYVKERRKRIALEAKLKEGNSGSTDSSITKEEGKLYARIYNSQDIPADIADDAVDRVSRIAELDGVSLEEAYKSDDFQFWKEGAVKKHKEKQAQLGASRGSRASRKKSLDTSGLTQEEHKALYLEKYGS